MNKYTILNQSVNGSDIFENIVDTFSRHKSFFRKSVYVVPWSARVCKSMYECDRFYKKHTRVYQVRVPCTWVWQRSSERIVHTTRAEWVGWWVGGQETGGLMDGGSQAQRGGIVPRLLGRPACMAKSTICGQSCLPAWQRAPALLASPANVPA